MSIFEKDWEDFSFLSTELEKGIVTYLDDSHSLFQAIMTNYPITFNRIDWDLIPHESYHIEEKYPDNKEVISLIVSGIVREEGLDMTQQVKVCFDGYTSGALSMPLTLFLKHAAEIFTIPQHTYVLPQDVSWCLNYTFENFIYFGYSPKMKKH